MNLFVFLQTTNKKFAFEIYLPLVENRASRMGQIGCHTLLLISHNCLQLLLHQVDMKTGVKCQ